MSRVAVAKEEGAAFWQGRVQELGRDLDRAFSRKQEYHLRRRALLDALARGDASAASELAGQQRPDDDAIEALQVALKTAEERLAVARAAEATAYRETARKQARELILERIARARAYDEAAALLQKAHDRYLALGDELQATPEIANRLAIGGGRSLLEQAFGMNRPVIALPHCAKDWATKMLVLAASPYISLEASERSVWAIHLRGLE